jgi:uncharacterized protein (DUF2237 family)
MGNLPRVRISKAYMERRTLRTERAGDHWFLRISRYNRAPRIGFNPPSPTHSNTKLRGKELADLQKDLPEE